MSSNFSVALCVHPALNSVPEGFHDKTLGAYAGRHPQLPYVASGVRSSDDCPVE